MCSESWVSSSRCMMYSQCAGSLCAPVHSALVLWPCWMKQYLYTAW